MVAAKPRTGPRASDGADPGVGSGVEPRADVEWLDIVDAGNRVIGRAPRDVVHRDGHRHRAVHMMLFDSDGRVFVQRRSPLKDTNPGLWDASAAGHVDSGEAVIDAAVRELHEELGLRVGREALVHTGSLSPRAATGNEFVEIYRLISDAPLVLQKEEIVEGRWLDTAALETWLIDSPSAFTDVFHAVWRSVSGDLS